MKERPILFSAPMVRALLDGSKTQTRRALTTQPSDVLPMDGEKAGREWIGLMEREPKPSGTVFRCKFGEPGDHLWVRETHRPIFGQTCGLIGVDYQADPREKWERLGDAPDSLIKSKWTPSIHMRREYSRILLEITAVRVERLQDISEADAKAEGVRPDEVRQISVFGASADERAATYKRAAVRPFQELWENINGAGSWAGNPLVWVVEFKRVQP